LEKNVTFFLLFFLLFNAVVAMMTFAGALGFLRAIDPVMVTGISLWALTLYLSLARLRQRTMEGLQQWLNAIKQPSNSYPVQIRAVSNGQSDLWASLLSIVPFLIGGGLCHYGIALSLGQSWAISFGIMGVMLSGIYELARASGASG
jgi:hypothetical protein